MKNKKNYQEKYEKLFFFKIHAENEAGRLVPNLFLFFKKASFYQAKVVCSLVSINFDSHQLVIQ